KWMGYIDVAAFIQQYDDMMEFSYGQWGSSTSNEVGGIGFKSINVGTTRITGAELSLSGQGKINSNLTINLIAGYTYMNPISLELDYVYGEDYYEKPLTYRSSGSDSTMLKYRYEHIAKTDIEIVYNDISIGGSMRYNSFMKNIDKIFTSPYLPALTGISGINQARDKFKDGDLIIDIRAGYQMTKTARLGFIVNNLLNREYMSRPANMMPPRTFAMQLALKI
ncbi:MAG: TonB-dependent receptor domain-containing protein, partial [Flavobacteriales bacterium]